MHLANFQLFCYPIGFIASFLFGIRFLLQWLQSEQKGYCYVPSLFWKLSLVGSCVMSLHGYIQHQFPVSLIHGLNAVIAWRNINLIQKQPKKISKIIIFLCFFCIGINLLFIIPKYGFHCDIEWMTSPKILRKTIVNIPWYIHTLGFIGFTFFSSRFVIQWYHAEKKTPQNLPLQFWALSLFGGSLCLVYFIFLWDPVNIINYASGIIPYSRNLLFCLRSIKPPLAINRNIQKISFFLLAGEQSGDQLGASLISSLKQAFPNSSFTGVGGPLMGKEGMSLLFSMEKLQIIGLSKLYKKMFFIIKLFFQLKNCILKTNPHVVIFIDFPDFNMMLSKALKKKKYSGLQCHYVCPSIWAWRKKRKKSLEENLDLLMCLFSFEKHLFDSSVLHADYVGHPLVNMVLTAPKNPDWKKEAKLPAHTKPILAIFPGSRKKEILLNFPTQLTAFKQSRLYPDYQPVICVSRSDFLPLLNNISEENDCTPCYISSEYKYSLMADAELAIAKSGTITLELALMKVPTLVTYILSSVDFYIFRYFFRFTVSSFALPNILSEKIVFPEFIGPKKYVSTMDVANGLNALSLPQSREKSIASCQEIITLLTTINNREATVQSIIAAMQRKDIYGYTSSSSNRLEPSLNS